IVWSRVVVSTQISNHHAGTITKDNVPEDLLAAFEEKRSTVVPARFAKSKDDVIVEQAQTDWSQHEHATLLAKALLIGAWSGSNQKDQELVASVLGEGGLGTIREILYEP